eukprot:Gregarina_sp_Poly_1__3395@NODE_1983_length_2938_cov_45_218042_g1277_i0_p4_GENE_NODE_1983_length_2938_cov_45_218042_g1277_i0NODE_1983_length_2938_cov_45_218042_g1277_i0_p4_ORF_typecomplete_len112_score7_93DUF4444/PF14563_6/0_23_NODE_1983_length_2938_cov_45_218042_g1277_i055390
MDENFGALLRSVGRQLSVGILATLVGGVVQVLSLDSLARVNFVQVCCQGNELLQVQCEHCARMQYRRVGVLADLCYASGGMLEIGLVFSTRRVLSQFQVFQSPSASSVAVR